jgi:hypothetical protein
LSGCWVRPGAIQPGGAQLEAAGAGQPGRVSHCVEESEKLALAQARGGLEAAKESRRHEGIRRHPASEVAWHRLDLDLDHETPISRLSNVAMLHERMLVDECRESFAGSGELFHVFDVVAPGTLIGVPIGRSVVKLNRNKIRSDLKRSNTGVSTDVAVRFHA